MVEKTRNLIRDVWLTSLLFLSIIIMPTLASYGMEHSAPMVAEGLDRNSGSDAIAQWRLYLVISGVYWSAAIIIIATSVIWKAPYGKTLRQVISASASVIPIK
jgi:hypothetical protein